jgi:hypothetical protein
MKKNTNQAFINRAKKRSWDDLANDIIKLENSIRKQNKTKLLILLKNKLKILEEEKSNRLFNSFNMKTFLNKNNEEF